MPVRKQRYLFLLFALLMFGCIDSRLLTGVFRSVDPITIPFIEGDSELHVELVLGHYGPDVAGLIRFYGNPDFNIPPSDSRISPCYLLTKGAYSAQKTLTFSIALNPSDSSDEEGNMVSVSLSFDEPSQSLQGTLSTAQGETIAILFVRHKDESELVSEDKTCEEQ